MVLGWRGAQKLQEMIILGIDNDAFCPCFFIDLDHIIVQTIQMAVRLTTMSAFLFRRNALLAQRDGTMSHAFCKILRFSSSNAICCFSISRCASIGCSDAIPISSSRHHVLLILVEGGLEKVPSRLFFLLLLFSHSVRCAATCFCIPTRCLNELPAVYVGDA